MVLNDLRFVVLARIRCRFTTIIGVLELIEVLVTCALHPGAILIVANLSIEHFGVGSALAHVDVKLCHHPVIELLLTPCSHGHIKLAFLLVLILLQLFLLKPTYEDFTFGFTSHNDLAVPGHSLRC